ncbi:hypothetical protein JCGZ_23094 [Jatropha curcas]|uniref:Uncharacterized protein n=1 Tax=Jatropha curcas TaxID=180498 RepID=A0A067JH76_JATCU|nr:uncharacterized protein LOC105647301 [Jatropha curcas]KDP23261.1 hypothetical protein JCGZ_23094 [Jatropha curcas]
MALPALSASLISSRELFSSRVKPATSPGKLAAAYKLRNGSIKCKAVGESSQTSFQPTVYKGVYGTWTLEKSDVREVILYRSGLVTAASAFVIAASDTFLPSDSLVGEIINQNLDLLYALGAGGLGLSLLLIHIYVTEIKRTLQALWALGVVGSFATYTTLAQPAGVSLVQYVIDNPITVWFVGPLFAALTGLVFKEGLCYGKLEAGILTFIIPTVLLGHLTGLMDNGAKLALLYSWMALFVIFAGRKFTQAIKDDVGDKSVFMFNSLQEDEKKALIEKLEQQKFSQDLN